MKSKDLGAIALRAPEAANEEFADAPALETVARVPAAGWDPYEVWRTRVKDDAQLAELDSRTA